MGLLGYCLNLITCCDNCGESRGGALFKDPVNHAFKTTFFMKVLVVSNSFIDVRSHFGLVLCVAKSSA